MSKQIIVNSEVVSLESGAYRVDVKVENAPVNLFGGGFDLKIKAAGSDVKGFSLDSYSLGSVFAVDKHDGVASFSHLDSENNSVVFGISMLRSNHYSVNDGVLASFVVRPVAKEGEMISISFERGFLSGFDGASRFDFNDVVWSGNAFVFSSSGAVGKTGNNQAVTAQKGSEKVGVNDGKSGSLVSVSDDKTALATTVLNGLGSNGGPSVSSSNGTSLGTVAVANSGRDNSIEFWGKGYVISDLYWFLGIMLFLSVLFFLSFRLSGRLARETSLIE